jgi:steroid 5-alpha reductase family enzyme
LFGTPLPFAVLLGIGAFVLQWLVFIPSFLASTEHFYDLTGSLTYLSMVWIAFGISSTAPTYKSDDFYVAPRKIMIAVLITVWALRLGYFLFLRVRTDGKDVRFDKIKMNFGRFLIAWSLQGLWICLTLCSALVTLSLPRPKPLWAVDWVGLGIWIIGFGLEAIADFQKRRFKADPANKGKYIDTGLWSISRHPNYLGEIIL